MSKFSRVLLISAVVVLVTAIGLVVTTAQDFTPIPGITCVVNVARLGFYADASMTQKYGELTSGAPVHISSVSGNWFQHDAGWSLWQSSSGVQSLDCSASGQGGGAIGAQSAGASLELTPTLVGVSAAYPNFSIVGVPPSVPAGDVQVASGQFVNTLGMGTQALFAEPGTLLVGLGFDQKVVDGAGGSIEYFSPLNQVFLNQTDDSGKAQPTTVPLAEGRYVWFTGGYGKLSVNNGMTITLDQAVGHEWFVVMRSLNTDKRADLGKDLAVTVSDYAAGFSQVMLFPPGLFVSEGALIQTVDSAHTNDSCGNEGCTRLTLVVLDMNTGGWSVVRHTVKDGWQFVASNWTDGSSG